MKKDKAGHDLWVYLTDGDIYDAEDELPQDLYEFARIIEQKIREKNDANCRVESDSE